MTLINVGNQSWWKIAALITVAVLGLFGSSWLALDLSHKQDIASLNKFYNQRAGSDSLSIEKLRNEKNQEIAKINQNLVSEKAAKEALGHKASEYKRINAYLEQKVLTSIKNIKTEWKPRSDTLDLSQFEGCVPIDSVNKYFIQIPKSFELDTSKWYYLSGTATKSGFVLDSMSFLTHDEFILGKRKRKAWELFKSIEPEFKVTHNNPYQTTLSMTNLVVKDDRTKSGKFFTSRPMLFIYGFGSGFIVNSLLLNNRR